MRRRIAVILLLLPILAAASGLLWLRSALPGPETRRLAGLTAAVRIDRDANGVPTITAGNDTDLAFALGYVHAQDRLFQMDLQRRYAAGRLAEWFGSTAVGSDRSMRILGLGRAAARQMAGLSAETQGALKAYAAGVNAYIQNRRSALSPEYYLLRAEPEPWRAEDTLLWGKLMAWQLASNYRLELVRARLALQAKPEDVGALLSILYPQYPADAPSVLQELRGALLTLPLDALVAQAPSNEEPVRASNNWVVSGERSRSGKPVLANDPHLGLAAPGVWYLARLVTPQHSITGGTIAGSPIVVVGHNERIAWGFTNTGSDVSDLFVEKLDPSDPDKYVTPSGAEPFQVIEETIAVRGAPAVPLKIRETRHGPVISDGLPNPKAAVESGYVLALQATYLMDGDRTPESLWELNRAVDWSSFLAALDKFDAPQQNAVYADVDGHIGFATRARVPTRGKGDGWTASPGWSGEYDWTGFVPLDQEPAVLDPPNGRVVSANNRIVPEDFAYFLGRDWDLPWRAERITAMLNLRAQTIESSSAIQLDTYSTMAEHLLPLMVDAAGGSPAARNAAERLKGWDKHFDKDKIEPLIFTAWLRELNRTLLADKLGTAFDAYWNLHPEVIENILWQHPEWCDDRTTVVVEVCSEQIASALNRALEQLRQAYGDDMNQWRWGRAHQAQFKHPLLSRVPLLGRWYDLQIPADGGNDTVNRGGMDIRDATNPYADVHGPGLRMVIDMADPAAARFMVTPGQSGNPLSPMYGDLMLPWRDGYMMLVDGQPAVITTTLLPP